ncbi:MAG TPA: hypothetical protein VF916_03110 [Ktedonobacterales bacterium]|jgi:hypothetical protein
MTTVRFSYQLTDPATSVGSLTMDGQRAAYECYHSNDALAGFVRAVIALMRGAPQAECVWGFSTGEGGLRWLFTRHGDDVTISTTAFRRPGDMREGRRGCRRTVGTCNLMQLAKEVRRELRAFMDQWGAEEYRAQWRLNDYPVAEAEMLDKLIRGAKVEEPPQPEPRRRKSHRKRK